MEKDNEKKEAKWPALAMLLVGLFIFSLGGVCSKMAGQEKFLSLRFCIWLGLLILILGVYALIWQQALKRVPLIVAYACKGTGVFFGILWGVLFFGETVRPAMFAGAGLVLVGVFFFLRDEFGKGKDGQSGRDGKEEAK
ncbi:MAG: DMT family transporter [Lachnospiraceae bacterium]|nr:DMT family transporter [Lachnospiraceae bacterium]